MGFLGFLQTSPVKRLEKEAEDNPSPDSLVALAQKYIEMGEMDRAVEVAEKGIGLFRDASRLRDIVSFVKKKRSQEEIKRLREEIRVRPAPPAYAQLASLYRELGDLDQSLDLLAECIERFADDPVAHLMTAQIRLDNFLRELIAYDGIHAMKALRRVKEISPENSPARVAMAQLCYAVGANALCAAELRAEVEASPTSLDLKDFLEQIGTPASLSEDVTVESLIEKAEDRGALPNNLLGFPRFRGRTQAGGDAPRLNSSALQAQAQAAGKSPGCRNVAVLDREGSTVASFQGAGALAPEAFQLLLREVVEVCSDSARRMDIGSFARAGAQFHGGGGLAVTRLRGLVFAILYQDPMRRERAESLVGELATRTVGTGPGRA